MSAGYDGAYCTPPAPAASGTSSPAAGGRCSHPGTPIARRTPSGTSSPAALPMPSLGALLGGSSAVVPTASPSATPPGSRVASPASAARIGGGAVAHSGPDAAGPSLDDAAPLVEDVDEVAVMPEDPSDAAVLKAVFSSPSKSATGANTGGNRTAPMPLMRMASPSGSGAGTRAAPAPGIASGTTARTGGAPTSNLRICTTSADVLLVEDASSSALPPLTPSHTMPSLGQAAGSAVLAGGQAGAAGSMMAGSSSAPVLAMGSHGASSPDAAATIAASAIAAAARGVASSTAASAGSSATTTPGSTSPFSSASSTPAATPRRATMRVAGMDRFVTVTAVASPDNLRAAATGDLTLAQVEADASLVPQPGLVLTQADETPTMAAAEDVEEATGDARGMPTKGGESRMSLKRLALQALGANVCGWRGRKLAVPATRSVKRGVGAEEAGARGVQSTEWTRVLKTVAGCGAAGYGGCRLRGVRMSAPWPSFIHAA